MMYNALLHVQKSCHVVTSVLGHVKIANKGVHMNCVSIHVVDGLFVHTVVKPCAASLALLVTENVTDVALMGNVRNAVPKCVIRAINPALGFALTTSAKIFVEKNATALDVMPRVPRSCLAAIHALVCVAKTAPLCAPSAILRSFLPC